MSDRDGLPDSALTSSCTDLGAEHGPHPVLGSLGSFWTPAHPFISGPSSHPSVDLHLDRNLASAHLVLFRFDVFGPADSAGAPQQATGGAAVLLLISGEPRQAILTWLSSHVVDLPPLPTEALREAAAFALRTHFQGRAG